MIDFTTACHQMADLLAGITDDQLPHDTPCSEYAVRDLIQHVDQVSQGFTALALKSLTEDETTVTTFGTNWQRDVAEHVRALGAAWSTPASWQGVTTTGGLDLTNETWGKIAFTEIVVHGWDLAKATHQPFTLPEETLRACLDHVTDFVPKAPVATLWGPAVEVPTNAPLIDRVVAITGRTP